MLHIHEEALIVYGLQSHFLFLFENFLLTVQCIIDGALPQIRVLLVSGHFILAFFVAYVAKLEEEIDVLVHFTLLSVV